LTGAVKPLRVRLSGFLYPPIYRGNMASSGSDARRWREWLRSVVDSLCRLEGESGLEFCESAALIIGQELKEHQPAAKTVAELIVAERSQPSSRPVLRRMSILHGLEPRLSKSSATA